MLLLRGYAPAEFFSKLLVALGIDHLVPKPDPNASPATLSGIAELLMKLGIGSTVKQLPQSPPIDPTLNKSSALPLYPNNAKIQITKWEFYPPRSVFKDLPGLQMPWPVINVVYKNTSSTPTQGLVGKHTIVIPDTFPSDAEVYTRQDSILKYKGWWKDVQSTRNTELEKNDERYFTIPYKWDAEGEALRVNADAIMGRAKRLYVFVAFKYLDRNMPGNALGVTETCVFFFGSGTPHECGRNRSFLEVQQ